MANPGADGPGSLAFGSAAAAILQRAVELDHKQRYTESLICYEQGLTLLLEISKSTTDAGKKQHYRKKMEEYMSRAETIKKHVAEKKALGNYRELVTIDANSKGHSYETVFGRFLDNEVHTIEVEDAYIRSFHQCQNFLRFCELAVRKCQNLKKILLVTKVEGSPQAARDQQQWLETLRESLLLHSISLNINISETLHDRVIRLSNGWIIKIGRGLDYFKPPENKFSLGVFDMDLRPCYETSVDIYHEKDINLKR